jgi:hypothetical protein
MAKSKTPIYVDSELLEAAAARAAEEGTTADGVVETALREYLFGLAAALKKVRRGKGLDEDEAMDLAIREIKAHRAGK